MELKDRIREAMEASGLKPLQFAKATGVSSGAVTHWINGSTKALKAETAMKIQAVTGYSAGWLITGRGDKSPLNTVMPTPGLPSPGGMEIAALYDLIPVQDQIKRVKAWNLATAAILSVLESETSTTQPIAGQKKQSA